MKYIMYTASHLQGARMTYMHTGIPLLLQLGAHTHCFRPALVTRLPDR